MKFDRNDHLSLVALVLTALALIFLLLQQQPARARDKTEASGDVLARVARAQAEARMLEELFSPVVKDLEANQYAQGLLRLSELERRYPGQPFADLLRGELLYRSGAQDQAVSALSRAVRSEGDFIDDRSPLSRRPLIESLVSTLLPVYRQKAAAGNLSARDQLGELRYLQSRLAGGCE